MNQTATLLLLGQFLMAMGGILLIFQMKKAALKLVVAGLLLMAVGSAAPMLSKKTEATYVQ